MIFQRQLGGLDLSKMESTQSSISTLEIQTTFQWKSASIVGQLSSDSFPFARAVAGQANSEEGWGLLENIWHGPRMKQISPRSPIVRGMAALGFLAGEKEH